MYISECQVTSFLSSQHSENSELLFCAAAITIATTKRRYVPKKSLSGKQNKETT